MLLFTYIYEANSYSEAVKGRVAIIFWYQQSEMCIGDKLLSRNKKI